MSSIPRISVLMLAYNHEIFAEQAIRSVLQQQVDADFEIVIGEDCSTDGTRAVLDRMRELAPDRIRVIYRGRNVGLLPNFIETYHACRGEFVAWCSCDDYWIDPAKLQKQLDAMLRHPQWSLTFHAARIERDDNPDTIELTPELNFPEETGFPEIVKRCCMTTGSIFLRRSLLPELPDWYADMQFEDWPLEILLSAQGPLGFLPETMSVWRMHRLGLTAQLTAASTLRGQLTMYDRLEEHFTDSPDFRRMVRQARNAAALAVAQQKDALLRDYHRMQNCWSYRLGIALTTPARWLARSLGLRR